MIFTKKDGSAIARTQVSLFIQKLALEAKVPAEKGNIRALRQLYKTTISGIEANFDLLVRQAYERLCTRVGQTTAQKLTGLDGTEYLV